tara:strand:- start:271 stop:594 length:324 start_codon:yes stop_codon:yes gene_type:complete
MSRKSKMDNASKLINIISTLMDKQEALLNHIGELEEYIDILESMGDFEQGEKFISYTADDEFKEILDKGLTQDQKDRVEQIKKEKQSLHSMEDILSIFDEKDKDEEK